MTDYCCNFNILKFFFSVLFLLKCKRDVEINDDDDDDLGLPRPTYEKKASIYL